MTTLFQNGVGLNFSAPFSTSTTYTQQSWGGNWSGPYFTQQWYGKNLTYVAGSVTPATGTLTQLIVTSPTTGQVIISVSDTNYSLKDSDIGVSVDTLALNMVFASTTPVNIVGGSGNESLSWYAGPGITTIDGGPGTDTLTLSQNFSNYQFANYNSVTNTVSIRSIAANVEATITGIENLTFKDKSVSFSNLVSTLTPPTYSLTAVNTSVDEGATAVFNLVTTNVTAGTTLTYSIAGVTSADLTSGLLTGTVAVGSDGKASINIGIKADNFTEGAETLILSLSGATASTIVKDTSLSQTTTEIHTLSVIVDKGILGADAVILKGLVEKMTLTNGVVSNHTVQFGNTTFDYSQIDSLIMTVTSDGNFTAEFRKEITDLLPAAANFSYQDTVKLVGTANIDNVILYVAGADGNFVG